MSTLSMLQVIHAYWKVHSDIVEFQWQKCVRYLANILWHAPSLRGVCPLDLLLILLSHPSDLHETALAHAQHASKLCNTTMRLLAASLAREGQTG